MATRDRAAVPKMKEKWGEGTERTSSCRKANSASDLRAFTSEFLSVVWGSEVL